MSRGQDAHQAVPEEYQAERHVQESTITTESPDETGRTPPTGWRRFVAFLRRTGDAFTRHMQAAAMAEEGTRDMALEQLDEPREDGSEV